MNCPKCSKDIPADSLFCCYCGSRLVGSSRSGSSHAPKRRGNGQGSVFKRPCGTWAAQITLGYYTDANGKRKIKNRTKYGFKTKKEAIAHLNALLSGFEKNKVITLSELWTLYQSDLQALSKSKRTAYNIAWRKIEKELAFRTIDSLTVPELQKIVDTVAPSYYTRKDIKQLLSNLYKIAIRDDYEDKNRAEFIKLPTLETSERETFTAEDKKKLWSDYAAAPSRITAAMLVMLYTGIRAGELLTIRTENIHLQEHYMTGGIKTTKGKRRKIIIPDKLAPVVKYLIQSANNGRLAYFRKDDDFYEAWKEKRAALNISEALTPYCCRHTYITELTALKVSPAMLQELAGHEDYNTTLDYTHLSVMDRLAEVNKLE